MNKLWYYFWNRIVTLALFFTFRKRKAYHTENIPKNEPIIFVANHQNGLIDAIMIPTIPMQRMHFITRSDVFKNPIVGRILRSFYMIPIYRLRDGREKLAKNAEILDYCANLLVNNEKIQMFPEGNHNPERSVRPFKKGFADIAFMAMEKKPDLPIKIVPVGINYDIKNDFPATVALFYGEPISVLDYYNPADLKKSALDLNDAANAAVKKLTTHIEPKEEYNQLHKQLEDEGIDFLDPVAANKLVETRAFKGGQAIVKEQNLFGKVLVFIFGILNIIPLSIWRNAKKGIKDKTFVNTFRFVFVLAVFPIYHLIVGGVVAFFWGASIGIAYLTGNILLALLRKQLPYWY